MSTHLEHMPPPTSTAKPTPTVSAERQTRGEPGHRWGHMVSCMLTKIIMNQTHMVTASTITLQNPLSWEHINKTAWQLTLREDLVYSIRNANLETLKLLLAGGPVWEKHHIPAPPYHGGLCFIGQGKTPELLKWNAPRFIWRVSCGCQTVQYWAASMHSETEREGDRAHERGIKSK